MKSVKNIIHNNLNSNKKIGAVISVKELKNMYRGNLKILKKTARARVSKINVVKQPTKRSLQIQQNSQRNYSKNGKIIINSICKHKISWKESTIKINNKKFSRRYHHFRLLFSPQSSRKKCMVSIKQAHYKWD